MDDRVKYAIGAVAVLGLILAIVILLQQEELPDIPPPAPPDVPVPNPPMPEAPEQLGNTSCYAVIPGHNEPDHERVNVVFVGFEMDQDAFVSLLPLFVDYNGTGLTTQVEENQKITSEGETDVFTENRTFTFRGLLGIEPFKSNRDKFNFWYVDEIQNVSIAAKFSNRNATAAATRTDNYCESDIAQSCGLANTYPIHICNVTGRSFGSWIRNKAYIGSVYFFPKPGGTIWQREGAFNPYIIRTIVHEFGHSFGGLMDEYTMADGSASPGEPNCAPDLETAQQWWGDLVGQGEGDMEIGYFEGCSYALDNIRPTNKSLMRITSSPIYDFGIVNEQHLQQLLDQYSGLYMENIVDVDPVPPPRNQTDEEKRS
ncbi:MAG TPA: M64 family metallopeptidase [Candidatus Bilamarchaeaceae archaeon]|nr:M64 family metallopeptidase [Candidatus Bilamarchaeaceae archaeon]